MYSPVHLQQRDVSNRAGRDRWRALWNQIWPEFAETDAELQHELAQARTHRAWIVVDDAGRDVGLVQVERIRWNDDTAPPLAYLMLLGGEQRSERYVQLARSCATFAQEQGFDELRIYGWERERALVETVEAWPGWRIVERDVDVQLDLSRPPTVAAQRPMPNGVAFYALSDRPDLRRGAWEALAAALVDIPGDEPQAVPSYEAWLVEHAGPMHRDDARFAAVVDERVVGLAELETPELQLAQGVAWHGYTAVHPSARGHGIALALKQHVIVWARQHDVRYLRTENEERNAPMRHINALLGYEPVPARVVLRGPLASMLV